MDSAMGGAAKVRSSRTGANIGAHAAARALHWTLNVDTAEHPIGDVMSRLSAMGNVLDITINNPPMEEIIAAIFEDKKTGG